MNKLTTLMLCLCFVLTSCRDRQAQENESLEFLYSTMSLPDSVDYTKDFYLENIRSSLRAREEMPWGKTVPEREFRHFVLPVRVNNEDLDMSRPVIYEELKDRVKSLSMTDAILEINHWCHEKATYQPSDSRTNSPLATMRSALGRCGEESTFTVAALRAMGIPARQVYTPRWAHTDDNHAWVEAWADGKWYFLGACEPEPVLNLAWFNEPASRGMMMSTNVAGRYDGPEEVLDTTDISTKINVTSNYAPVKKIEVTVLDSDGKPAAGAQTAFCLYNYAEFYPIAVKTADAQGHASLLAGLGDMVVWATDGTKFGLAKVSSAQPNTVVLDKDADFEGELDFDIVPPPVRPSSNPATAEQIATNNVRKAYEDSVRMAYTATFYDSARSEALADELGLDKERVEKVMTGSRGNHAVIEGFLKSTSPELRDKALILLEQIAVKDLNDVTAEVLADHLATPEVPSPLFDEYVLNPRVEREYLTPYKHILSQIETDDPEAWVMENITVDESRNPQHLRMSPEGVMRHRVTDKISRSVFFVALCRSHGIPARIDPVTSKTQRAGEDGRWVDVTFGDKDAPVSEKGSMRLEARGTMPSVTPAYYSRFSLSKIEKGMPVLQGYPEEATLADFSAEPVESDAGQYVLVTGKRLADGGVLAKVRFFQVRPDAVSRVPFELRHSDTAVEVLGSFNSEDIYHDSATDTDKSILSTTGRGYYVLGLIEPSHEPSAHALNDISSLAGEFDEKGVKMLLLLPDADAAVRFDRSLYPNLPSNVVFGTDIDGKIASEITGNMELKSSDKPIFIIADTFNRVVFLRQGYTIGLGREINEILDNIK